MGRIFLSALIALLILGNGRAEEIPTWQKNTWHDANREMRYQPEGNCFVIKNGSRRFNRALYGTNSAFRVETGDLPEMALYLPGMGGNIKLGASVNNNSKWLTQFKSIEARYEAGAMRYILKDPLLKDGAIVVDVLALGDSEGMILRIEGEHLPADCHWYWIYGGVTGKRFNRDGDVGADPESSFYLKPEYCVDNQFQVGVGQFSLFYGSGRDRSINERYENNYKPTEQEIAQTKFADKKRIVGVCSPKSILKIGDAMHQESPLNCFGALQSAKEPLICGNAILSNDTPCYLLIQNPTKEVSTDYSQLSSLFASADAIRKKIASRVIVETPDPYINAVGNTLTTAADGVWDGESFMHGAIAWRMPLNGWRGAYAADWLGWHDRAKSHIDGYLKAQYTAPLSGPSVPDPAANLARQKEEVGTALFTSGYIGRSPNRENKPHHYDMNLVFIDQVLSHYQWTGDLEEVRANWPAIERHLAWEKRNFDGDNDGLYDAYCCIWASDALQYSGGGVTHSSAYNYRANLMAAQLATLIGKDAKPYQKEANKIRQAMNKYLWMPSKGWYAESRDLLGNRLVHPSAALWTVYHAIDEGAANSFEAYQLTKYIDNCIPHIPIKAKGLPVDTYYTLSTTNWMPYAWSTNNVASSEIYHTALSYWQAGRPEEAFKLAKGTFLDYMFLGVSPGNFGQLSFYDAFRGELYRDFADAIGMASRVIVEGMFGLMPDMLNSKLYLRPGWPADWSYARMTTPDFKLNFERRGSVDRYQLESSLSKPSSLCLQVRSRYDQILSVIVNGTETPWKVSPNAIGQPIIEVVTPVGKSYDIRVEWGKQLLNRPKIQSVYAKGEVFNLSADARILDLYDPQNVLSDPKREDKSLTGKLAGELGGRTFFVKMAQNKMIWWEPISFDLRKPFEVIAPKEQGKGEIHFAVKNNNRSSKKVAVEIAGKKVEWNLSAGSVSKEIRLSSGSLFPGTNRISIQSEGVTQTEVVINPQIQLPSAVKAEMIDLQNKFNDKVTSIFKEQYLSPRSPYPTLAIPIQGVGDWCSFKETSLIDDSGVRRLAGTANRLVSPQGIPFTTTGGTGSNIIFTSKWDNYPSQVKINLTGKGSHLYLLMAGSTHHMQSRMINGLVRVEYSDGSQEVLELSNPDSWWPIDQDYYEDGFAFRLEQPRPLRLYLKTGEWHYDTYQTLTRNKAKKIDGGAASVVDLPLNQNKELKSLHVETIANDVVVGLMAATLIR